MKSYGPGFDAYQARLIPKGDAQWVGQALRTTSPSDPCGSGPGYRELGVGVGGLGRDTELGFSIESSSHQTNTGVFNRDGQRGWGGGGGGALTGSMTFIWMDSALLLSLGSECRTHHLPRTRRGHQRTFTAPYAPAPQPRPHALSLALALQGAPARRPWSMRRALLRRLVGARATRAPSVACERRLLTSFPGVHARGRS